MMVGENNDMEPSLVNQHGQALTRGEAPSSGQQAVQLETLKAELETLKTSVAAVTSQAKSLAGTSVNVAVADAEEVLRRNVFASVAIAAVVGYLWGRTR